MIKKSCSILVSLIAVTLLNSGGPSHAGLEAQPPPILAELVASPTAQPPTSTPTTTPTPISNPSDTSTATLIPTVTLILHKINLALNQGAKEESYRGQR